MKSVNMALLDLPPNTSAQMLWNTAYYGHFLLMQVLYRVLHMLNMVLCMLLPVFTALTWLSLSMFATPCPCAQRCLSLGNQASV